MLYLVKLDTGNMSEPYSIALVEGDSLEKAISKARNSFSEEGLDYDATAEPYEGGLLLKEGVTLAWLN